MSGGLIWAGGRIALNNVKIIVHGYIIRMISYNNKVYNYSWRYCRITLLKEKSLTLRVHRHAGDKNLPIKLANVQDEWYNNIARWKKYYVPRQTRSSCHWAKRSAFIKWKMNSTNTTLQGVNCFSRLRGRSSFLWVILKKDAHLAKSFISKKSWYHADFRQIIRKLCGN